MGDLLVKKKMYYAVNNIFIAKGLLPFMSEEIKCLILLEHSIFKYENKIFLDFF